MRYNGLNLVIGMAVAKLDAPLLQRYQDALVLGAVREDVLFLPVKGKGRIWEHWSFSHFSGPLLGGGFIPLLYPGAPASAQRYFNAAVASWQRNQHGKALIELGRASHLLIDMACPVHAHRVAHFTDGYEWYVEGNCDTLKVLSFDIPDHQRPVRDIVRAMARFTQQFAPDRSNHHWGRLLKSWGLRRSLTRDEFAQQAAQIIPTAAGHLAAMYRQFLERAEAC
jgi:hypothetical protein